MTNISIQLAVAHCRDLVERKVTKKKYTLENLEIFFTPMMCFKLAFWKVWSKFYILIYGMPYDFCISMNTRAKKLSCDTEITLHTLAGKNCKLLNLYC